MVEDKKCVLIIDEELPVGLIANTAAVLSMTLGKHNGELVGCDVTDAHGQAYAGITTIPLPILKGNASIFKSIQSKVDDSLYCVQFFDVAQQCKTYDDYMEKMQRCDTSTLNVLGIGLCGNKKAINKLTGQMSLLR